MGDAVGDSVGLAVGDSVGDAVGLSVGLALLVPVLFLSINGLWYVLCKDFKDPKVSNNRKATKESMESHAMTTSLLVLQPTIVLRGGAEAEGSGESRERALFELFL